MYRASRRQNNARLIATIKTGILFSFVCSKQAFWPDQHLLITKIQTRGILPGVQEFPALDLRPKAKGHGAAQKSSKGRRDTAVDGQNLAGDIGCI